MKKIDIEKISNDLISFTSRYSTYEAFSSKISGKAYEFTKAVGADVCLYCNINYTYTVFDENGEKVVRPNLDHAECRTSQNQVQYDNLIPCCPICNMNLKNDVSLQRHSHLHPYYDDFDKVVRMGINLKSLNYMDEKSFDIVFLPRSKNKTEFKKAKNNIKLFKLKQRYKYHKNEVINSFEKIAYYHKEKLCEYSNLLNEGNSLAHYLLFKDRTLEINKVSLGKLKKDIAENYG